MNHVEARRPHADAPVVRLENCGGAIIRGSKAWPGTRAFLSVEPGQSKAVILDGNQLALAKLPIEEATADFWKAAKKASKKK